MSELELKVKDAQAKYGLTDTQLNNIRQQFSAYDSNQDGKIVATEVKSLLQKVGIDATEATVNSFIEDMDKDKDGAIELWEFVEKVGRKMARTHTTMHTNEQPRKRTKPNQE